jgi:hypothetical protein
MRRLILMVGLVVAPGSSLEAAVQLATPKGHPQP